VNAKQHHEMMNYDRKELRREIKETLSVLVKSADGSSRWVSFRDPVVDSKGKGNQTVMVARALVNGQHHFARVQVKCGPGDEWSDTVAYELLLERAIVEIINQVMDRIAWEDSRYFIKSSMWEILFGRLLRE